jgi:hypothetical protein
LVVAAAGLAVPGVVAAGPVAEVAPEVVRLMQAVCGNQAKALVAAALVQAVGERAEAVAV